MSDPYDFLDKPSASSSSDPYSFLDGAASKPADEPRGDYMRGLAKYLPQTQALAGDVQTIAGLALRKNLGEGPVGDYLIEHGLQNRDAGNAAVEAVGSKESDSFTNAIGQGPSALADWAQHGLGQLTGNMVENIAAAGAGALAGGAVGATPGAATGAIAGLVEKAAVKAGIRATAEKLLVTQGKEVADAYAKKAIGRMVGANAGIAGMAGFHGVAEPGGRAIDEATANGGALENVDLGRVATVAPLHAAAEFVGDKLALKGVFGTGAGASGKGALGYAASLAKGAGKVMAGEVPTEMAQTELERYAAGLPLTNAEAGKEVIDAGAQAALFGVAGLPSGHRAHFAAKEANAANAPAATPAQTAGMDQTNAEADSSLAAYAGMNAAPAGLIPSVPSVIVPPSLGGAAAVAPEEKGKAGQVEQMATEEPNFLKAYTTQAQAQQNLEQRADKDRLAVTPHPRVDGAFAVVSKSQQELDTQDAKAKAGTSAETRNATVTSEEEAVSAESKRMDALAHEAATSPLNKIPMPSEEQIKSGNYKKGKVKLHGLTVAIENPAGSIRSGVTPDGKPWSTKLKHHYGYIKGTVGADKDHVDVFLTPQAPHASLAWVIDQKNKDGSFDEHKVVLGPDNVQAAKDAYLANYQSGWDGFGAMTAMTMEQFKSWVAGGKTHVPLAYVAGATTQDNQQAAAGDVAQTELAPTEAQKMVTPAQEKADTAAKLRAQMEAKTRAATLASEETAVETEAKQVATAAKSATKPGKSSSTLAAEQAAADEAAQNELAPAEVQSTAEILADKIKRDEVTARLKAGRDAKKIKRDEVTARLKAGRDAKAASKAKKAADFKANLEAAAAKKAAEGGMKKSNQRATDAMRAKGELTADQEITNVERADLPNANEVPKGAMSKQLLDSLTRLAKLFGKTVQLFSGPIAADGFVIDNKTIYINVNSKVAHAAVFGHELLHQLKHDVPQAYAALARVIRANMSKESWAKFEAYYNDPSMKGDALIEEGVADLMGNRFIEPEFWADVFSQVEQQYSPLEAKAIIRTLSQAIVKIINKVINVLGGSAFKTDQYVSGDMKAVKAALVKATAEYMRELKSRGDRPAEALGASKLARRAPEERKGRTLDEVRSRVAATMPLAVSPDMRKLLNGQDFETLNRNVAGPGLLIDDADVAMRRMMDESVAESLLTPELAALLKVPTKAYVDKALQLTNGARFWYALSAEGFAGKYFKLARALTEHLIDIVAGTSGGQKPTDNLRIAIAAMSQDKQGLPVTTGVRDPSSLTGALSPTALTTHKFGNFSDTMQTVAGLRDVKPLPTIDLQMASVFGIEHAEVASNPVMYETISRFLLKLRDAQNAKLKNGEQPYESWQMQALLWVANRSAADPDSYDIGMPKIVNQLQAAGIPTPGGRITIETLMDPRTAETLAPTTKSVPETPTMTLETRTQRTSVGRSSTAVFNAIKNITDPWAKKLSAEFEMIQRRSMRALTEKQPNPNAPKTKSPSIISQLMSLIMGKTLASYDATRVDTEGWGTFEDEASPNVRIPLLLGQRGGSDGKGGTPRFEMTKPQRLQLMSVLGKDIKQAAMANSRFVSAVMGQHDTFSVLIKRYDKVDITESQLAEFTALIGRPINYSRIPNGWLLDINIGGFDPFTDIDALRATLLKFDVPEAVGYHEIPRAFSSDYIEASDYAKHIRNLENAITRDTNAGRGGSDGRAAQRLSDLARIRGQVQGIVAQQERAFRLWERNARTIADKRGIKLSTGRNDGASDGQLRAGAAGTGGTAGDGAGRYSSGGTTPLEGAPTIPGASGPDERLVSVADAYAKKVGITLRRQDHYVAIDEDRARRLAAAYEAMPHAPNDPEVKAAYADLIKQTTAQYQALVDAGYRFWFFDPENDPYQGNPWNAMRDLRANQSMGVFPTEAGFGSNATEVDVSDNPLNEDTGLMWSYGALDGPKKRVLANDLFRAVHDAFGHGIEGAGFRDRGEENAWQAHSRLFTGPALAALTSETRGQNSWLNYGPNAEKNKTAKVEDTVFADQKSGLLPEWAWTEGRAGDMKLSKTRAVDTESAEFKAWFGDSKVVDADGKPLRVYHGTTTDFDEFTVGQHWNKSGYLNHAVFLSDSPEYASGFAGDAGRVMPVYLSITKLKDLTKSGDKDTWKKFISLSDSPSKYIESLKRQGFDGAVIPDYNPSTGEYSKTYIAFSPTQIKSAISNTGAFSSTNPDIRMSPGRATGVHYSKQQREYLSSSAYGTGTKAAEAARLAEATDPRLKHRIYFYVNGGKGINPEFGVGPHAHQADLANLYDMDNDPRDLALGRDANGFGSAVLDAGFDGIIAPSRGIAVQLGPRSTRVKYLGMTTPTVAQVENDQPGPRTAAQRAIAARRDLPGGQMTGEAWKARLPEMSLSHLQDGEMYYKSALVPVPKRDIEEHEKVEARFSRGRAMTPPKNTIVGYKLFRLKAGELFPLFIGKNQPTKVGEWIAAQHIPTKGFAERPGWHAGTLPTAPHLRTKEGFKAADRVWAEVELPADVDWQSKADKSGTRDIRDKVPKNGHYRFKTNKMQGGAWIIGGALKVNRVLSNADVADILTKAGELDAVGPETGVKLSTSRQQDAFAEDFATKATTITDTVTVSTKGDTEEVERSNVNSAGRQIANTKSGLRRFWDWYAGSPEDINGKPILLYHSTAGDITTFETMRETTNTGMFDVPFKSRRAGIFLTPNVRFAESYAEGKANSNTMQVYARMQNPADFRHGMSPDLERALEANGINARAIRQLQYDWEMFEEEYGGPAIVAALKAAGYDGAIINEDDEQGKSQDTYVAFDPEQIKSATGNRGSWNETNPDIRMSKTRAEIAAGADVIKAMSEDERDNLQPSEAPGGWHAYELYEARKLLQKPTEKLKRVTENNSFILHQDYDSIANVDGVHFGINKYEDPDEPDDDSKFVYAFNRIDDPLNTTETSTDQQDELLTEMRSKLSKTRAVDTESPEFRNWFGDSKVVDADGKPLKVYHSTSADKDFLRFNKRVGDIGNHFGTVGQAEDRWQYVNKFGGDEKNLRIMPVYLAIKNPLRLTDAGAWNADNLTYQLAEKFPQDATQIRKLKSTKDIREFIQSKGYDGVVYKNTGETAGADEYRRAVQIAKAGLPGEWIASAKHSYSEDDQKHPAYIKWNEAEKAYQQFREDSAEDSYIAFSPTQIKSAISNTGEFDGTNPDIQMSRQRLSDQLQNMVGQSDGVNLVLDDYTDSEVELVNIESVTKNRGDGSRAMEKLTSSADKLNINLMLIPAGDQAKRDRLESFYARFGFENDGDVMRRPTNPNIQMSRQRLADAITNVDLHNNLLNGVRNQFADIIAPSQGFNLWHKTVGTQFHKASTNPEFKKVFDLGQKFLDDLQLFAIRAEDRSTSIFPRELLKLGLSAQDNALLGNLLAEGTLMNGADPHTGVVFTDSQLRAKGLTDAQIKHYREARAAINESLNSLAGSEMAQHLRIQGAPLSEIERVAKADISLADKHTQFSSLVAALQLANPGKDYSETRKHLKGILSTTTNLQAHGYAPLSRFGKYNVTAWNAAGGVEFFTMTDTMSEARALERQLKQDPNVTRTQTNETDTESFKVFAGVTPDTLELFANHAAAGPINDLMQEYLQMAVSNRSTMKRMIKRGGISGFSSDATRVLASFITSNGRRASTNLHMANLGDAVTEIKQGGVKNEAAKLFEYLKNPGEEAAALRGFLFFNFLGGSIAAGIVNMTQPLLMTLPYLSKYGTAKAGAAMTKALTDTSAFMRGKTVSDPTLQQALLRAKSDGHINPQEIYQMMAAANTGNSSFLGHKFTRVWGANFAITEMFNRTLTFAAAYQLAKDSGSATAYDDAVLAINETQGIYNKGNRPNWARGAVGSTLFTFKQYSISYMEFMKRGWGDGIIPKKQFVLTAAFLMLAAGASGAPGADDLDDIIDTVGNWLGYATNSKRWKRQFLTSVLGKELGEFALVGISRYLPLDVQARLGVGNLIPGTGMFNPTKADKTREVTEVFGPAGGVATGLGDAAAGIAKGDGRGAALAVLPTPMRNAYQAAEMWSTGKYKDRGNKLVTEATKTEAIIKAVGFQPANVATVQRSIREAQGEADIVKSKQTEFMTRISNAIADGDQDGRTEAMADLKSWNENNPEYKVRLNPGAIQQAVKLRRMSKDVRFIKQIPKTIRGRIHEELQQ